MVPKDKRAAGGALPDKELPKDKEKPCPVWMSRESSCPYWHAGYRDTAVGGWSEQICCSIRAICWSAFCTPPCTPVTTPGGNPGLLVGMLFKANVIAFCAPD